MQKPLRVAMLSVHTCPLAVLGGKKTGGMNVYVRELSRELGRRGIAVDVFTRSQDPCVPHVNASDLGPGARVIHVPAGPEEPLATGDIFPHLPEFVERVQEFARYQHLTYDLIHSHYWLSGWAAERLKSAWGIPVLQMFHTLGLMKNRVTADPAQHEGLLRIETERQVMRSADRLIAATPAERIQLMWLYGADMQRIHVIPPGVDLNHFCPMPKAEARRRLGLPEDHRMLLFVGRLEPLKGVDTLLQAIAILKQSRSDATDDLCLSVIGGPESDAEDDVEMARLKRLRQDLGLGAFVTFLGSKSQETLQYYYSAAEAVVMPSHYESFGMVALEAMACGTPVIASEVGGLAYLIQDGVTGFHVPDQQPDELAGRVRVLMENDALRQEMSRAALQVAQRYAWPHIASQVEAQYQSVIYRGR